LDKLKPMDVILSLLYSNLLDSGTIKSSLKKDIFLNQTMKLADINGVYYLFLLKLQEIGINIPSQQNRFKDELKKLGELKRTIEFLNKTSKSIKCKFMIIKACNEIPHVPRDIDILVKEKDKVTFTKKFHESGYKCIYSTNVETSYQKEGYLKIDIYTRIRYLTIDFIDPEYLWDSYIVRKFFDIKYPTLENDANILLMFAHSLYGHRNMTLLDFLHIKRALNNTDIANCRKLANQGGWKNTFNMIYSKFGEITNSISTNDSRSISFPYRFSPSFINQSISQLNQVKLSKKTRIFLYLSFILDRFLFDMQKTRLYDSLSNNYWIRKKMNSFNYFIRHGCGDDKSM